MAKVKLFGMYRKITGKGEIKIPGNSLRNIIEKIIETYPGLETILLENGIIRPHVRILIDGKDSYLSGGLDTIIDQDSTISIFPPIAGG